MDFRRLVDAHIAHYYTQEVIFEKLSEILDPQCTICLFVFFIIFFLNFIMDVYD